MKRLILAFTIVLLSGCVTLNVHDPNTVKQIDATIKFEQEDYEMSKQALEEAEAKGQSLLELEIRHKSEMSRLDAWKMAEEAKRIPGKG
jgi:hypothetical protein